MDDTGQGIAHHFSGSNFRFGNVCCEAGEEDFSQYSDGNDKWTLDKWGRSFQVGTFLLYRRFLTHFGHILFYFRSIFLLVNSL